MQATRAQRALSKAQEAWEAERAALAGQLAQAAARPAQQDAQDWSWERRQLLQRSEQLAEQLVAVQQQAQEAQHAQVWRCATISAYSYSSWQNLISAE